MSASGPPLCRICQKEHWMRDPHILPNNAPAEKRAKRPQIIATYTPDGEDRSLARARAAGSPTSPEGAPRRTSGTNTRREGRRVLKAEAARPDATRTAGTPRPNPPPATQNTGKRASRAAKPSPGKRKPRTKANKRKGKKCKSSVSTRD